MIAEPNTVTLTIDGQTVIVDSNLTILAAARQSNIFIPTLCHHPALSDWGGCRLCVVQVDQSPKLTASCVTPVRQGMEVVTDNAVISASRRQTVELLLVERNHNCMFCPASGECELQQAAYALKLDHLTTSQSFAEFPVDTTSHYISLDHNRCILCGRCVRACAEISGCHVLGFHNRGSKTLIGFDLLSRRDESGCTHCGVCLQVCPTGALSNRFRTHYAVHGQPQQKKIIESVCSQCALLCPTRNVVRANQLINVDGILSDSAGGPDKGQLCHIGRFDVLKNSNRRLQSPMVKDEQGRWHECSWQEAAAYGIDGLKGTAGIYGAHSLFGLISGYASNEILLFFKQLMQKVWQADHIDTLEGGHYRNIMEAASDFDQASFMENPLPKIRQADMILTLGADFSVRHSLFLSLLNRIFLENKIPIAAIDGRAHNNFFSTHHLTISEAELPAVLTYLADSDSNASHVQSMPKLLNDERQKILEDIAFTYKMAALPVIIGGVGLTSQPKGLVEAFRLSNCKKKSGGPVSPLVLLPPAGNSVAALRLAMVAANNAQNLSGGGVVLLTRENEPALTAWQSGQKSPAFLVVITPYRHEELAEIAHVMLPCALWSEEDGTYGGLSGLEMVFKPKLIDPPKKVKQNWEILQLLGEGSGTALPRFTLSGLREKVAGFLKTTIDSS